MGAAPRREVPLEGGVPGHGHALSVCSCPEYVAAPALAGLNSVLGGLSGLCSGCPPLHPWRVPGYCHHVRGSWGAQAHSTCPFPCPQSQLQGEGGPRQGLKLRPERLPLEGIISCLTSVVDRVAVAWHDPWA